MDLGLVLATLVALAIALAVVGGGYAAKLMLYAAKTQRRVDRGEPHDAEAITPLPAILVPLAAPAALPGAMVATARLKHVRSSMRRNSPRHCVGLRLRSDGGR